MKNYIHKENLSTKFALETFLGKTFNSNNCGEFEVIGIYDTYRNNSNTLLRYICKFKNTGFETLALATAIKNGNVKDRYAKILCGVGYVGDYDGEYSKHFLFVHWQRMIERCYNNKNIYYREFGEVDERWYSFSNFIEDCKYLLGYNEMIEHLEDNFTVDKDYIKEGNYIYSKNNCCFLPQSLNAFILNTKKNRDYDFEGLHLRTDSFKFRASIRFEGKTKHIIESKNPKIVHEAYWKEKFNIANIYFANKYSYLSNEIKQIVYNRINLKYIASNKELNRAINDGYFDLLIKNGVNNND